MNPALLNYLQTADANQLPEDVESQQMIPQEQAPYNPFDEGIRKAITSARESLGMTDKQQEKALRRSMLAFAGNMAQQPKQRGFFNNFGAISRSLAPAIATHDDAEEEALKQNNALADQILKYREAEEKKRSKAEHYNWRRQHEENRLAEQKRYHNEVLKNQRLRFNNKKGQSGKDQFSVDLPENLQGLQNDLIPITSKSERNSHSKIKAGSGTALHELHSIKDAYDQFRELVKDDLIDPQTPYGIGKAVNTGKDFFGWFAKSDDERGKALRKETAARKTLQARIDQLSLTLEKEKQGGRLGEGMVKRFDAKETFPSLTDRPDVLEGKLNDLINTATADYEAANTSLKYNVHISPYDLHKLKGQSIPSQNPSTNEEPEIPEEQEWVIMIDPRTGERQEVYFEDVPTALDKGLRRE